MWRFLGICFLILIGRTIAAQSLNDFRSIGDGDWNNNGTWERFNGSTWVPAVFAPQLADGRITVRTGHTVTMVNSDELVDDVVVDGTLIIDVGVLMEFPPLVMGDALTVNGVLELFGFIDLSVSSIVRVNGTFIAYQFSAFTGSSTSNLFFEANSSYEHFYISGASSVPLATWNSSSTCYFRGSFSNLPSNMNQSFGNIIFNLTGGTLLQLNGQLQNIRGNFVIESTHSKPMRLGGATNYTLNVDGDFTRNGSGLFTWNTAAGVTNTINVLGSFNHINGTLSLNAGTLNLNIAENYSWNNGLFTAAPGSTANIHFNGVSAQNFQNTTHNLFTGVVNASVASGSILDLGVSSIAGASTTFTLNSGATLRVGSGNSTGSIVNSTSLGNIRVGGARTFNTASTIIYNGIGDQFLGSGHPSIAGITTIIDNDVTLAVSPFTINGDLILNNGNLNIAASAVTFGGSVTPGPGALVADASTNITINDVGSTADFGALSITNTSIIGDLTIAGTTGRNVKLASNLAIANLLTLSNGELELNGFTLNIQSGFNQTGGNLLGSFTSGLNITGEGLGSLPPSVLIAGGSLGTLTLNRVGATFATPSNLILTNLNLLAGTFTHTGLITMQSNGTISVDAGILTNPVSATTTYNVNYVGNTDINTANELPVSPTVLNNLTNLKVAPAIVTLSANATVNGDLVLSEGTFDGANRTLTLRGDFISNANSIFSSGTVIFDGTTLISGDSIPQFGNLNVNATKSLAIEDDLQINIARDITINGTFEPNQSTVLLDSAFSQIISGSGAIEFYRLEIEKAGQNVTIQTDVSIHDVLNIRTATTLNAGDQLLSLISNANRTARVNPLITGADIVGTVIVQRYLPNTANSRAYRYLTPQVTNTYVADWQEEVPISGPFDNPTTNFPGIVSANPSMFYYDETYTAGGTTLESRYRNYPASGNSAAAPLINGLGYALFVRFTTPIVMDSRGTLAQHQKIVNVTAQSPSGNNGWNLIGNPYPSPILWDKVSRSGGVDNAVYIPDNTNISGQGIGTFVTYVGGISIPEGFDGMIDSGQGFWVHATSNGVLTFNETDKIISSDSAAQIYRLKPESDLLRLIVTGASGRDEMVVRFLADATDTFDGQFDALKLTNASLNLFTITSDGRNMAINTLGDLSCQRSIPISMSNLKTGIHTLNVKGIESFGTDVNVILVDAEQNLEIDLRDQAVFTFSITNQNINTIGSRFTLNIDKKRILNNLLVSAEAVCSDRMFTSAILHKTQPEVEYKIVLGDKEFSDWIFGTSENLQFNIPVKLLSIGENAFTVLTRNSCISSELNTPLLINKIQVPQIPVVADVLVCQTNATLLEAQGAMADDEYMWYYSLDEVVPFKTASQGIVSLTGLPAGTSNFYVSIKNLAGCESERAKVMVQVTEFDSVFIERSGNTLISSHRSGNAWFYNGELLNETSNELIISRSGSYKVVVNINGCFTQIESYEFVTKEGFSVFPNPTAGDTELYFDLDYSTAEVEIYSLTGGKVLSESIISAQRSRPYTLPMKEFSSGLYLIKVKLEDRVYTQRIIKL